MRKKNLLKLAEDAQASTFAGTGAKIGAGAGLLAAIYKGLPLKRKLGTTAWWGIAGLAGGGLINRQNQTLNSKEEIINV